MKYPFNSNVLVYVFNFNVFGWSPICEIVTKELMNVPFHILFDKVDTY